MSALLLFAAVLGCLYTLVAAALLRRPRRPRALSAATAVPWPKGLPSVTILKPLHGDELFLYRNLATFCRQDYDGPVEIIFGVSDPGDPAIQAVLQLEADLPDVDIRLVVDGRRRGQNGKVSNLMNMAEHARNEVIVLADSDMVVEADYLSGLMADLAPADVGAVTCLYHGLTLPNIWSRLAAQWIDAHFLPNALLGIACGLARPCFGSTIALRRSTLEAIGGFASVKDQLADDYALGAAVRRLGLKVVVPRDIVPGHLCAARSFSALMRQELRWARTIRALDPLGFAGSLVTNPLPIALLAAAAAGFAPLSLAVVAAALACRAVLHHRVAAFIRMEPESPLLGPVRDILAFFIFFTSYLPGSIDWRGNRFALRPDGSLASPDIAGS